MYDNFYLIHLLAVISKLIRKIKIPSKLCVIFNKRYHRYIMNKLLPLFNHVYFSLSNKGILNNSKQFNKIIWILWWQGYSNMPLIVKSCFRSIIKYANGYKVILITRHNIEQYADIPNYIYSKLYNGEITFTHFSDILRFNLLDNYGGIWMDSTIYCTSNINLKLKSYSNNIYTSGGKPDKYNFFVSSNKWTGFLIGGCKQSPIFTFMNEFFKQYWKYNDKLIDYFLIDYALKFCYMKNIGYFKYYVNKYAYLNNPHLGDLQYLLNKPYDAELFNQLRKDTNLFKLTYKMKFKSDNTFYKRIISRGER